MKTMESLGTRTLCRRSKAKGSLKTSLRPWSLKVQVQGIRHEDQERKKTFWKFFISRRHVESLQWSVHALFKSVQSQWNIIQLLQFLVSVVHPILMTQYFLIFWIFVMKVSIFCNPVSWKISVFQPISYGFCWSIALYLYMCVRVYIIKYNKIS